MTIIQDMFTKMVLHMRYQNAKCSVEGFCKYRYDGMSCAVGCLISDSAYNKNLEEQDADDPEVIAALQDSGWDCNHELVKKFMKRMQKIHDNYAVEEWEDIFIGIAKEYGLVVP